VVTLWTVRERKRERETNLKQAEDHQERKQLKSSPHAKSKTTCAAAAAAQHKPPTLKKQEDCLCSRSTQTHNLKRQKDFAAAQHKPKISKKQKNLCRSSTQSQQSEKQKEFV
jgi:hypothetical protein